MNDFYIHLSSDNSMEYFPNNTGSMFSVQFPQEIPLKGEWCCALTEIRFQSLGQEEMILCSNIIESVFTNGVRLPVLRRFCKKVKYIEFVHRHYIPVSLRSLQFVDMYVLDRSRQPVSFSSGILKCTLHFKQM